MKRTLFLVYLITLCLSAHTRAVTPTAEHLIRTLLTLQETNPNNTELAKLNQQLNALQHGYQHADVNTQAGTSTAVQKPCTLCGDTRNPPILDSDCPHKLCTGCQRQYLQTHQGTLQTFRCWDPKCETSTTLTALGHFLRATAKDDLYLAAVKTLIRHAGIDAAFCPQCGGSITLPSAKHGHSATCTQCSYQGCFACNRSAHGEIPCDQVEGTQASQLLFLREIALGAQAHLFGFCPHCKVLTEHKDGCDAMTCGQNAADKRPIHFKRDSSLQQQVTSSTQTSRGTAGCGRAFNWHHRVTLNQYLTQHDPEWSTRHAAQIRQAEAHSSSSHHNVMGQRLTRAQLQRRLAAGQSIEGADLRSIDLRGIEVAGLRFPSCILDTEQVRYLIRSGGSLERANLTQTTLDLQGLSLANISLRGTRLDRAQVLALYDAGQRNFAGAHLDDINLWGVDLSGINLHSASLRGANLMGIELRGADLRDADLWDATLWGADFCNAQLRGANYRDQDLWSVDLTDADHHGVDTEDHNPEDNPLQQLFTMGWSALSRYL
ncbi:MAG: pentapeptide repeat-containing protein [Zetaproteobacteria bacterium]|nr:pentapeptide repeat-containing protein [Zetaproteobacteria bacterium]